MDRELPLIADDGPKTFLCVFTRQCVPPHHSYYACCRSNHESRAIEKHHSLKLLFNKVVRWRSLQTIGDIALCGLGVAGSYVKVEVNMNRPNNTISQYSFMHCRSCG